MMLDESDWQGNANEILTVKNKKNEQPLEDDHAAQYKKTWFQSLKRPIYGFLFAMLASLFNVLANLLLKKTKFFNAFDNSAIRYVVQLIILFFVAKLNNLSILGDRKNLGLLIFRGSISGIGLIALYSSIKLIDPSDAVSLFSCNVLFVAILSRIFMKEKLTIMHIIALIVIVCGVILITQPSFLIPRNKAILSDFINSTENVSLIITSNSTSDDSSSIIFSSIGIFLAIFAGFVYASASILIKELSKRKQHFSIINLYAGYFGLPLSMMFVIAAHETGYDSKDYSFLYETEFTWEIVYSIISAITGVCSQITWILSLKFEDATKIAMYRTSDLLLTFLLQYFLLDIASNIYSIAGSFCIGIGMMTVMAYKMIDKNQQDKQKKLLMKNLSKKEKLIEDEEFYDEVNNQGCFKKFILYKF